MNNWKILLIVVSLVLSCILLTGCEEDKENTIYGKVVNSQQVKTKSTNVDITDTVITYNSTAVQQEQIIVRETFKRDTDRYGKYYEETEVTLFSSTDKRLQPDDFNRITLVKVKDKPKELLITYNKYDRSCTVTYK